MMDKRPFNTKLFYDYSDNRLKVIAAVTVIIFLAANILFNMLDAPKLDRKAAKELPPRMTKMLLEKRLPPPEPEKPKQEEKKEEEKKEEPKPEEKKKEEKKEEPKKKTEEEIRKKVQSTGVLAMMDELADLRDDSLLEGLDNNEMLLDTPVESAMSRERSVITANAMKGSGGIDSSRLSRSTGGETQLAGRSVTQVQSPIGGQPEEEDKKSARSHEEIALVIDRNKSKLLSIYQRAIRDDPTLRGQVVFEITIDPSGKVTNVKVVSSDLKNPELEKKLSLRMKLFKFGAKDVEVMIVTVPIDFYPS
jgi:TonB family protein